MVASAGSGFGSVFGTVAGSGTAARLEAPEKAPEKENTAGNAKLTAAPGAQEQVEEKKKKTNKRLAFSDDVQTVETVPDEAKTVPGRGPLHEDAGQTPGYGFAIASLMEEIGRAHV